MNQNATAGVNVALDCVPVSSNDCGASQLTTTRNNGVSQALLRSRQKIGKYSIIGRIASGPLATVYRAYDTIQKRRVALKIPKEGHHTGHEEFLHEVQVATKLQHPNILSVLNASFIDDHFVIAMELG